MQKEIIFIVEESLDGGYEARALGHSIFTEGDNDLAENVRDAVMCHFDLNEEELHNFHIILQTI
ncbi:MAG: 2-oxoisovalerate dehydrogenase [Firmicutes bacterium]|nr:2-oxoisovalerate dehydrogenase [Bacillota bacterium]